MLQRRVLAHAQPPAPCSYDSRNAVPQDLATAHEAWDKNWTTASARARWLEADPHVRTLEPLLRQRNFTRILDVGCGIGRHAQYFASLGFSCVGIDASPSGLSFARQRATDAGLQIDYREAPFYQLPFNHQTFGALIAWNVIYHGDAEVVQRAIDEFSRVLVPGGLYVGSMLSKRNTSYGKGLQVRPDTFTVPDATDDKVHPHFYCDARTLLSLHRDFEVLSLQDREQSPGAYHWQFTLERQR